MYQMLADFGIKIDTKIIKILVFSFYILAGGQEVAGSNPVFPMP